MPIPHRNNKTKSWKKVLYRSFKDLKFFGNFFWVSTAVYHTPSDLVKLGIKMHWVNLV